MDLKVIQKQLKKLHEKIKEQGHLSDSDEQELKTLMQETLFTASSEINNIQHRLKIQVACTPSNNNRPLSADQIARLNIVEKTGTGSNAIH
jgi:protein subunit release factor A